MAKILAISHDAYLYGAQRSLLDAVIGLAAAGHQVEVCVPAAGDLVDALRAHAIPVHVVPFGRWIPSVRRGGSLDVLRALVRLPAGIVRALRLVRAGRCDVVYTNTVTVMDFAVAARLLRVPHVWHLRESAADNPQLRSPLANPAVLALVRALSARVIYNSRYLLDRYGAQAGSKDAVVHNGVRPAPPRQERQAAAIERRLVVLTAGFMNRRKGLDVLLDAVGLLPADLRARMVLRVAGDMDPVHRAQDLEPRLRQLGDTVELLGWSEDMDALLAQADLLVSSARDEPFGRTLVEAMMAGVPVLATRSGGPQEIVADGETGVLVPPDDPAQLAAALARLLREPRQLASLGHAGRQRALARFSLSAYVGGVERCLLQAVADAARSPAPSRSVRRRP